MPISYNPFTGEFDFLSTGAVSGSTDFTTDSGTASPAGGTINLVGGTGISTSASGSTVTITSTVSGTVTSVSGTTDRITSSGGTTPVIDIAAGYVGQTSITTLGTITTGVWNGTTIATTVGGTGLTSYTTGDILYASASNTLSKLAIDTDGDVLTLTSGIPSWETPAASGVTSVTGTTDRITSTGGSTPVIDIAATYVGQTSLTTLGTVTTGTWQSTDVGVAYGGTARSSHTAYAVICGGTTTTGAQQSIASVGTSGQVLTSNGAGSLPTMQTAAGGGITAIGSVVFMDDFVYGDTITSSNNDIWTSDNALVEVAQEAGHVGVMRLEGDSAGYVATEADICVFGGTILTYETLIHLTSISASGYGPQRMGFGDTRDESDDQQNGAYFEFDEDVDASWAIKTADGGSRTLTDSGIAATTDWVKLKIVVNAAATSIEYFIDDVSAGTITTNITSDDLALFYQVGNGSDTNENIVIDKVLVYNA